MNFLILEFSHETDCLRSFNVELDIDACSFFFCVFFSFFLVFIVARCSLLRVFVGGGGSRDIKHQVDHRMKGKVPNGCSCENANHYKQWRKAINDHVLHILTMILHTFDRIKGGKNIHANKSSVRSS